MLVHHDDAVREYAYGAESRIDTFSDPLMAEAKKKGWPVISMKDDWKTIFVFERKCRINMRRADCGAGGTGRGGRLRTPEAREGLPGCQEAPPFMHRKPRWLLPVLTSPLPRVPTM